MRAFLISLLGGLFLTAVAAAAEGRFLAEMEDLPLAPGLTENPGGMLFEQPSGRIVEASAVAALETEAGQIVAFYATTLPQLGWEKIGPAAYRRDNEMLRIDVDQRQKPLAVRFSVVPN